MRGRTRAFVMFLCVLTVLVVTAMARDDVVSDRYYDLGQYPYIN